MEGSERLSPAEAAATDASSRRARRLNRVLGPIENAPELDLLASLSLPHEWCAAHVNCPGVCDAA